MLTQMFNHSVNISLNNGMPDTAAHGRVWVRTPLAELPDNMTEIQAYEHGFRPVNFRVDRPAKLKDPRRSTLMEIRRQLNDLQLELLHVELEVNGELKLFACN